MAPEFNYTHKIIGFAYIHGVDTSIYAALEIWEFFFEKTANFYFSIM